MITAQRWHWLLRAEPGTGSTGEHLEAAVKLVPDVLAGAVASSITELDGGVYSTSAASSSCALDLDIAQYTDGDGPCMTAARDRQLQLVRDTASADRFAGFASAAAQRGVRSSLSIPISTPYHPAALNIYAAEPDAFDDNDRVVVAFLGRALTKRLQGSAGERPLTAQDASRVSQRRAVIQAALAAIAEPGSTPEQNFAALTARSVQERCSIHDLAARLVAATEGAA